MTYSKDGSGAAGADVGVVVVGETPYAEGFGDRRDLALGQEDLDAIANVKKAGIPVVVVVFSGRPLILGERLTQADALVAAWLPGTEGQGVADVLFGDYKPTGKLAVHLAALDGADPDQRGRREVRPALRLRLRPDVLSRASAGAARAARWPRRRS